jgi:hypothetical protein
MFTAVVLTGNHYIIDGILGIAVASIGLALASRLERDRSHLLSPPISRSRSALPSGDAGSDGENRASAGEARWPRAATAPQAANSSTRSFESG